MFNFTSLEDLRQSDSFSFRSVATSPEDGPQVHEGPVVTGGTTQSTVTGSSRVTTTEDDVDFDFDLDTVGTTSGTVGGSGTNEAGTETAELTSDAPTIRTVSGSTTTEVISIPGEEPTTETTTTQTRGDTSAATDIDALFASFGFTAPTTTAPQESDDSGSFMRTTTGTTTSAVNGSVTVMSDADDVDILIEMDAIGNVGGTFSGAGANDDISLSVTETFGFDGFGAGSGFDWGDFFG